MWFFKNIANNTSHTGTLQDKLLTKCYYSKLANYAPELINLTSGQ